MTIRPRLGLLCAAILLPGLASPVFGAADPRLVTRTYSPDEVVRIDGRPGVQAAITFDEGEHIENVAIGDSNAWQVTPNKRADALFVKPLSANARSNMTVITDRHTYYFDLVASASAKPLYVLRFAYPDQPKDADGAAQAGINGEEAALASGATPTDPAALNFGWSRKGKAILMPSRVYDDGNSVYLTWGAGEAIPAILIKDATGAEGPVNYAVRGEVIVIEGLPQQIVLRSGKDAATLDRATTPASRGDSGARAALADAAIQQGN
jgi:type IV secretion system protein VirB9